MANPQLENGYLRIASEIWRELRKIRIPGEAMQCLMVIIEKTYGWNKKDDIIPLSQFEEMTGIKKPHVIRATEKLKEMNIITKKGNGDSTTYSLQKDYEDWKPLPKKVTLPKKVKRITKKGNNPLPKKVPSINNKDTTINIDHPLQIFIKESCPRLSRLKEQLNENQCQQLLVGYTEIQIKDIFEAMDNYKPLTSKYISVYKTSLNWLKKRFGENGKSDLPDGFEGEFDSTTGKWT